MLLRYDINQTIFGSTAILLLKTFLTFKSSVAREIFFLSLKLLYLLFVAQKVTKTPGTRGVQIAPVSARELL